MVYLWVAIGGALGSVGRFWLGNAMALAVGSEFPWGTLLINVLGSFVISFFGMLTGTSQRFAVPNEARVFVTVGLCGGVTTKIDPPAEQLDGIVDRSLGRLLQNRRVDGHLGVVGSDASQRA